MGGSRVPDGLSPPRSLAPRVVAGNDGMRYSPGCWGARCLGALAQLRGTAPSARCWLPPSPPHGLGLCVRRGSASTTRRLSGTWPQLVAARYAGAEPALTRDYDRWLADVLATLGGYLGMGWSRLGMSVASPSSIGGASDGRVGGGTPRCVVVGGLWVVLLDFWVLIPDGWGVGGCGTRR